MSLNLILNLVVERGVKGFHLSFHLVSSPISRSRVHNESVGDFFFFCFFQQCGYVSVCTPVGSGVS